MVGAIIGDIVGSIYEFYSIKSEDFPLFTPGSRFTDDTVMTIAVAEALMTKWNTDYELERNFINSLQKYGRLYPYAGYGGMFREWIHSTEPKPYNSYGNGSAMRVSSIAWRFNTLEEVEKYAAISAKVTHDHPEGILGAVIVAGCIYLARNYDKNKIVQYVKENSNYNIDRHIADIRQDYKFDETCQGSIPEAIIAFLESESFEDAIRKAVSLGGDSDTLAAITGSIAEAYYPPISFEIIYEMISKLDERLINFLKNLRLEPYRYTSHNF